MISFGKFLGNGNRKEAVLEPVRTLVDAISDTAIDAGEAERMAFCSVVNSFSQRVMDADDQAALDHAISGTCTALSQYNGGVQQRWHAQQKELRSMITAGLETVAALSSSSDTVVQQLKAVEEKLQSAAETEDLRQLRNKLQACLTMIRNETVRMQMQTQKLVRALKAATLRASAELNHGSDQVTGLPGPEALARALSSDSTGEDRSIAVLVISDMRGINVRFGRTAGDDALRFAGEKLSEIFGDKATVHRWTGPAFVVAPISGVSSDELKEQVRALTRAPMQIQLGEELRTASVPLSSMIQLIPKGQLTDAAVRTIDEFIGDHIGQR